MFASIARLSVVVMLVFAACSKSYATIAPEAPSVPEVNASATTLAACDVRDFGAIGDGEHLDTVAIQAAVQSCAHRGGGTVHFGPGTYLSGSIQLRSNITLDLGQGSRLLGSSDVTQYVSIGRSSENRSTALLWALGAHNISISGPGVIDGNGRSFIDKANPHKAGGYDPSSTRQGPAAFARFSQNREGPVRMLSRPGVLVLLIECENVDLRQFHVVDAPNWCIHLACCRHAVITGLDVRNDPLVPNADALDVSNCQDVRISDVYLEAGDDGIAISPCADGYCQQPAENITVTNAVIVSRSAAIRVGWSVKGIRNVILTNIIIRDSNRGIGIFVRGNEKIENILVSNSIIETRMIDGDWWGMGEPVHVSVAPWKLQGLLGSVSNLRLVNIIAASQAPVLLYSQLPGHIHDVLFDGFDLKVGASPVTLLYGGNLDLRPVDPVERGISRYDVAGFKMENVDDVVIRNLHLGWTSTVPDFFQAGMEASGFHNLTVDAFAGSGPTDATPAIRLRHGTGATITNARATHGKLLLHEDVVGLTETSGHSLKGLTQPSSSAR